jgi:hypothetical protein
MRVRACSLFLIQHATRMRHIVKSFVAPLAPPYFSALFNKRQILEEKITQPKMCILIFSTTFVYNISHSKKNLARYFRKRENVSM